MRSGQIKVVEIDKTVCGRHLVKKSLRYVSICLNTVKLFIITIHLKLEFSFSRFK